MGKLFRAVLGVAILGLAATVSAMSWITPQASGSRDLVKPGTAQADAVAQLKALSSTERGALTAREVAAFKADPLDRQALQNLVVLRELDGQTPNSEAIALALAAYGRRSIVSQLSAIQINLTRQEFGEAFSRLDGVLRARPELGPQLFPSMLAQVADPKAGEQLWTLLATDPPWRDVFMKHVMTTDQTGGTAYNVARGILKAKGTVSDAEKRALLAQFVQAKQYDRAYFVWLDMLSPGDLLLVRNVFDGGFSATPKSMYFDWNIYSRKTANIAVGPRDGKPGDRVLRLDFFEDDAGGQYILQLLRMQPGQYNFSFDVQVEALKNETGLVWRVVCVESGAPIGESTPVSTKGPWETRRLAITVPEQACATQALTLENRSRARLDQKISGRLAFDNVEVTIAGEGGDKKTTEQEGN
jgi:hypothetical protein